ncbi:MAG TPA: Ig-like domain-containing protein, partial [Candidatus Saccharibacteria bacterium]|nr:Ig-like domain-containing protein [Candidatus Saccharibacteria bacterium]
TLKAQAWDSAGNTKVSTTISFTVSNAAADTTAPTTTITSPSNGSTVRRTITVRANASDNIRVTKVEFLVDGVVKATDTSSPYSFSWNSGTVSKGKHTLQTRAYDAAGNVGYSTVISVTVR